MTHTNIKSFTRVLAGMFITAVVAHAAPGSGNFFVRPFASYVGATDKDHTDTAAIGAAVGYALGAQQADELAFEASGFYYNLTASGGGSVGDETFVPTLLTYRHYFAPVNAFARFYVGAGAGVTEVITRFRYSGYGYRVNDTETAFPFTAEGSVGVALKLSNVVTLDLGYRYLHIDSRNVSGFGYTVASGAFDANTAYAGVGFRF